MKDFILKILSNRDLFSYEKLNYKDINKIQNVVLHSLGLTNINELRDLYEGVAFIEKFSLKVYGILALENFLKLDLIDWGTINPKTYSPTIIISNKMINVITSEYGEFPIINKINDSPAILAIKKDQKDVWICGFADINILNNHQEDNLLKGSMTKNINSKTAFVGFKHLKVFKNIEELENLLNEN